jgi:chromosome segregation ATPase
MKIFGIEFGRKKKIKIKKSKNYNAPIPQFDFLSKPTESKSEQDRKEDISSFPATEIILPEKSNVDIDDNNQIGFVPSENITDIIEKSDNKNLVSPTSSHLNYNSDVKSSTYDDNSLVSMVDSYTEKINEMELELNQLTNKIKDLNAEKEELDRITNEKKDTIKKLEEEIEKLNQQLTFEIDNNRSELDNLIKQIEEKKDELINLENSNKHLFTQRENELKQKISSLESQLGDLDKIIEEKQSQLSQLEQDILQKIEEGKNVDKKNAELILQTEKQFKEKIIELDSIINQKNNEISKLQSELRELTENFEKKKVEVQNWEAQNKSFQETIDNSKAELAELERRIIEIHSEAKELLSTKNEIYSEILKLQEELTQLKKEKETTLELIQLSQKRREEIEFSNDQLEKRLLKMIQKFDDEIKQLTSHKTEIEKKIEQLEESVSNNEKVISEKLEKLKETEDQLLLRQTELNSLNNFISSLSEKEVILNKTINSYEREISLKRNDNLELRKDIDLLTQKKSAIEKILEEFFAASEQRLVNLRESNFKTTNEIRDKEQLYEELNQKIEKAIDELVELQKSIHSQKIELKDLEIKSDNLKKLNESLEKEINKNYQIIEQFKKMKDEISDRTSDVRKDFSREFGIDNSDLDSDVNQKKIFRL